MVTKDRVDGMSNRFISSNRNSSCVPTIMKKVLVGMSGGVDSSLSAALLKRQGFEVAGGFIKNWSDTKDLWTGECQWRGERRDAMRVAAQLDIPLMTFDFEDQYRKRVLDRMFAEYEQGRTPNPDVLCNEEIKFGLFFEKAMELGFDYVATGHYAQISVDANGDAHLLKGVDDQKDQTYFLYRLSQNVLRRTMFPIGHLTKTQVRQEASQFGLATAEKADSQGICFVGKVDFKDFLRKRIPSKPGDVVDKDGKIVGSHDGLDGCTIGQRHGFHVKNDQRAWYVAKKNMGTNQLVVVPDREDPLLYSQASDVIDLHVTRDTLRDEIKTKGIACEAVIRYRTAAVSARLRCVTDGVFHLEFSQPVWALTPGQSVVLYQGNECIGGGILKA